MINILLESLFDIDAPWLAAELRNYIKPYHAVAVVAFSFRDSRVNCLSDWDSLYSKEQGTFYKGIVDRFISYGIQEENISFINYFADTKDSAAHKVKTADIIYFLGGLPDKMYDRIMEFELRDVLEQHKGIIMGDSAGAVIQLSEYHLAPDRDYPAFAYYKGLSYIDKFYLQVHYENTPIQNESIQRVLTERRKKVYATTFKKGAIIVDNGSTKLIGDVYSFDV